MSVQSFHREGTMSLSIHSAAQTSKLPYMVLTFWTNDWIAELDQFSLLRTLITESPGLVNSLDAVCYYFRAYVLAPTQFTRMNVLHYIGQHQRARLI